MARLRPMTTGEILDTALRTYQRLGLSFLRLTVAPALLCLTACAFVLYYVIPAFLFSGDGGNFLKHVGDVSLALFLAVFVGGPLFLSGLSFTTCVVVSLVSDFMVGNVPDPEGALAIARKAMPRLFLTSLRELVFSLSGILVSTAILLGGEWLATVTPETSVWAGVIAALGGLSMLVGGVIFLMILAGDALVAPIVVLEDAKTGEAGRRSRALMKPARFHGSGRQTITSLYTLLGFLTSVLTAGIGICLYFSDVGTFIENVTMGVPFQPLLLRAFELLPAFLVIWTVLPVWAATVTIVYYDRRIRLEGFDIEVLARDLAKRTSTRSYQL